MRRVAPQPPTRNGFSGVDDPSRRCETGEEGQSVLGGLRSPAPMHPHPLLGVGADLLLDDGGGGGRQLFNPILERSVGGNREGWVDLGFVGTIGATMDESRDHRTTFADGEHGAAGRGPCGPTEEGNKDSRNITDVLIDEKGGDTIAGQSADHLFAG